MNMPYSSQASHFLLFALLAALLVVYFIIQPFLAPLVLAAVCAFIFQPIYRRFLRLFGGHAGLSAFTSALVAIVIVILPLVILGTLVFREATTLFQTLASGSQSGLLDTVEAGVSQLLSAFSIPVSFNLDIGGYLRQGLEVLIQNIGAIFSSFARILLTTFVFLVAFYFFLKDGLKLKDYFVALSPLPDSDDELIATRLKSSISAVLKGSLTVGIIQGLLTGVGFAIFGVPNPTLWGSVAAITALIPGIGTALVLVPGILFLFFTGNTFGSVGLLAWGMVAVGLVDNVLGPGLVGKGMRLHPLAVFLSVLGGLVFFGPIGFLLGPLAMSVCLALIDIYFSLKKQENCEV